MSRSGSLGCRLAVMVCVGGGGGGRGSSRLTEESVS